MKKFISALLASIILASSMVFCASAWEKGFYPQGTVGEYTIAATEYYVMPAPHGSSLRMYNNYGVTDKNGNFIVEPIYSKINLPSCGRALYSIKGEDGSCYGFFDENWNVIENMKYDYARDFSENTAVVGVNIGAPSPIATTIRYGVTDKYGRLIVPVEYHWIPDAKDGRIEVQLYEQIYPISDHRSRIGYYSTNGTLLEAPIFRHDDSEYEAVTHVNSVRFGDTLLENTSLEYPIVISGVNGPYLPLTQENCRMLGIGISGNHLEGIKLWRDVTEPGKDGIGKSVMPQSGKAMMQKYGGAIIVDGTAYTNADAPLPMLYYKDTVYLPLYWVTLTQRLGLSYSYDFGTGIRIATENHVEATPQAAVPSFDVTLNGTKVDNTYRQYPLIVYKDITYFPMTYYDCRYLGLATQWDNDTRTLSINKEHITCAYRDYGTQTKNEGTYFPTVCDFNIIVNGRKINNTAETYPLLTFRDVTYFPLTWRFAVDEFGWDYEFTSEKGLLINSSNNKTSIVNLPKYTGGDVAFDENYYYYNVSENGKYYVYRAKTDDTSRAEAIYELPQSPLTNPVAFSRGEDGIYFSHQQGSSPTTGTAVFKKINPDGTVVDGKNQSSYAYGKHGSYELLKKEDGVSVHINAHYVENVIYKITVAKDGAEKEITGFPESLSVTYCMVDGKRIDRMPVLDCVRILGDKVYISAYDFEEKSGNNNLYVIDINTRKFQKLIEGIHGGFHVYHGPSYAETDVIIYGKDGKTMRYTTKDGKIAEIDTSAATGGLILEAACGTESVFTVWKSLGGDKTVVQKLANHAMNSFNDTIFETATGTSRKNGDGRLIVYTVGESPNDSARTAVFPWQNNVSYLLTSDAVSDIAVYDGTILYRLFDGTVVRVDK